MIVIVSTNSRKFKLLFNMQITIGCHSVLRWKFEWKWMKWNGNTEWRQKRIQRIPGLKTYLHIPMKYTSAMKEGYSRNNLQQRKKLYQMDTQRNTTSYSYRNMLGVRTSETHSAAPHVPLFSTYCILTSLMICYWTDPQQHRDYLTL